jgi:hypothetical protein
LPKPSATIPRHRTTLLRSIGPLLAFLFASACRAASPCAHTVPELRALVGDPAFPLQWRETSMDDGKPLTMSILERDGALFLSFAKSQEGLWAEGAADICARGSKLEARFLPDTLVAGPSAHWAMRYSLRRGGRFAFTRIDALRMKISTVGWSGVFATSPPE